MESGIYIIQNTNDGKVYIGQSVNINRRLKDHIRLLKLGKHKNTYLQRAYDKLVIVDTLQTYIMSTSKK